MAATVLRSPSRSEFKTLTLTMNVRMASLRIDASATEDDLTCPQHLLNDSEGKRDEPDPESMGNKVVILNPSTSVVAATRPTSTKVCTAS